MHSCCQEARHLNTPTEDGDGHAHGKLQHDVGWERLVLLLGELQGVAVCERSEGPSLAKGPRAVYGARRVQIG